MKLQCNLSLNLKLKLYRHAEKTLHLVRQVFFSYLLVSAVTSCSLPFSSVSENKNALRQFIETTSHVHNTCMYCRAYLQSSSSQTKFSPKINFVVVEKKIFNIATLERNGDL